MTAVDRDSPTAHTDTAEESAADQHAAIMLAIGEELRRLRTAADLTRPELVALMLKPIPVNTYSCYETGIRQCSIPRLVEICGALGVSSVEILRLAFQRLGIEPDPDDVLLDLVPRHRRLAR